MESEGGGSDRAARGRDAGRSHGPGAGLSDGTSPPRTFDLGSDWFGTGPTGGRAWDAPGDAPDVPTTSEPAGPSRDGSGAGGPSRDGLSIGRPVRDGLGADGLHRGESGAGGPDGDGVGRADTGSRGPGAHGPGSPGPGGPRAAGPYDGGRDVGSPDVGAHRTAPGAPGGPGPAGHTPDAQGPGSRSGAVPRAFADRYPAHIPLPPTAPRPVPVRGDFRPVTIRTARDAVAAAAGYLRWLGFRDVVQPEERPASGVDLRAPGLVAQVDPSTRPAGLRAVECLWLNGLSASSVSVFFSLAGYTPEARSRAAEIGLPLFVLDLTGTPQPVNLAAEDLASGGA